MLVLWAPGSNSWHWSSRTPGLQVLVYSCIKTELALLDWNIKPKQANFLVRDLAVKRFVKIWRELQLGKKVSKMLCSIYNNKSVFQILFIKITALEMSYKYCFTIIFTTIHHFWDFTVQVVGSGAAGRVWYIFAVIGTDHIYLMPVLYDWANFRS